MRPFCILTVLSLALLAPSLTVAEPYSVSCGIALGKVVKARKALIPFQRTMERARSKEQIALAEMVTCVRGGTFSLRKARRCTHATENAPRYIQETLTIQNEYLQGRQVFEERLEWAVQTCLLKP